MDDRIVIQADTTEWIKTQDSFDAVVTSLPDVEETGMDAEQWMEWFSSMVYEIIIRTKTYAVFYQTDRKYKSVLLDKAFLVAKGAKLVGAKMMWHKIALRRGVGSIDLFRPTYTHLICYSKEMTSGKATPDVIYAGEMVYKNAMGLDACKLAIDFIKQNAKVNTIVDPFCGKGSVLAVANKMGLNALGVDILSEQVESARLLRFSV